MKSNYCTTDPFLNKDLIKKIKQFFSGISAIVSVQFFTPMRTLLSAILCLISLSMYAQPTFNAATLDTPVDEYACFTGTNMVVDGGLSLYPNLTSGTFTLEIPACAGGTPVITQAYVNYFSRLGLITDPAASTHDNTMDFNINGSTTSYTAEEEFEARFLDVVSGATYQYWNMLNDITAQLQANLVAGTNTFSISNFDTPTSGSFLNNNYGFSVTVIYSCSEFPTTKTCHYTGNDFFIDRDTGFSGEFSSSFCMTFPAIPSSSTGALNAIVGGQANDAAPFRGGYYAYLSGSGTPPALDGVSGPGTGAIVNDPNANVSVNPAWTSNLGTEWDELNDNITLNAGDTWVCYQAESASAANTASGGSLNNLGYTITIPVTAAPCDPNIVTVCNDASDSATLTADAGLSNYQWYNEAGILVGETNQILIVNSNTPGMSDGSEDFYYEATDGNNCPGELCCPVTVTTESCAIPCPDPNCVNISIQQN